MPTLGEWALKPSPRPAIFVAALTRREIWLADRLKTLAPGSVRLLGPYGQQGRHGCRAQVDHRPFCSLVRLGSQDVLPARAIRSCLTSTIFAGSPLVPESAGSESCAGVTGAAAYLDAFSTMVCRRATNASRCPLSRESRGSWSSIPVISYSSNPREGLIDSRPPFHSNLDMPM